MSEAMITRRGGGGSSKLQAKTVAPAATASIVSPDSGYDGLSSVTVAAITPQKEAQIYTPGTADQIIAADRWLAGQQTILGDVNLLAANIKKGVSIFGVAGAFEAVLDTNSAILEVVTSTGCSVTVTNGTDTFTQQGAEGFVRPNDANVTEHFFVIPAAAFGTYSVTSTHPTYGDNTKTNAVVIGNAGRVYEVLCGGVNIILDSTFGLQEGYTLNTYWLYDSFDKRISARGYSSVGAYLFSPPWPIPVSAYSEIEITAGGYDHYITMVNEDQRELCRLNFPASDSGTVTASITNKSRPTAGLVCYCDVITSIILR